ncbi:MAG: hypothetical protein AAF515_05035 [Pseudomonadota bacterium]
MAVFDMPADIPPSAVSWRYIDSVQISRSPLSGAEQIRVLPGDRWGIDIDFTNLFDDQRTRLVAWAMKVGQRHTFRAYDRSYELPAVNGVSGSLVASDTTGAGGIRGEVIDLSHAGTGGASIPSGLRLRVGNQTVMVVEDVVDDGVGQFDNVEVRPSIREFTPNGTVLARAPVESMSIEFRLVSPVIGWDLTELAANDGWASSLTTLSAEEVVR